MSIPFDSWCLQCHLKRNLNLVRPLGSEEQTMDFLRDLMWLYASAPEGVSSIWFTPKTSLLLQKHYGLEKDRFRQEKLDSNRFVLERMDQIRELVQNAKDPVFAGLQFAILGNYLDFSALQGRVSFDELTGMLHSALDMQLDMSVYEKLCSQFRQGGKLLYLTDNAGEIGFDRIFAEEVHRCYPQMEITFCVRGDVTLNDATRADAETVGIPFPVIDNGNDYPGTMVEALSEEAKTAMEQADVIFAKGMANAETLYGSGYNVYYAFLVKCDRFVRLFDKPLLTPMLVRERTE